MVHRTTVAPEHRTVTPASENAAYKFKDALTRHYKSGRDRAEECLGDIIKILDQEGDQIEQILDRLVRHYSHDN